MQLNQWVRHFLRPLATTFAFAVLAEASSGAALAAAKPEIAAAIRQSLESRFPGTHVLDVEPSAIPGLYEVFTGDQIVYTDSEGDYVVIGSMVDTQTKENLTDARFNEHGKVDFKTLPLNQAIKVVKGNGSRVFAVFSDPDCPFCQQLEKTLLSVTDITMYVFLYPIPTLHPQAPEKAHAIWCAPDRVQAWSQWMQEKKLPSARSCSGDPVDALQKLGDTLHINSTPTLFFANGRRIAGALPVAELEKDLASGGVTQRSAPTTR
jgi:thiol:disulfide interchange protein DsbC